MSNAVTEEDVVAWEEDLRELTDSLSHLFARPEPKKVFSDFVRGLLADIPKKNSWGLADYLGGQMQAIGNTGHHP